MILLFWSVHGHLQQRIENFRYNLHAFLQDSSFSDDDYPVSGSTIAAVDDPAWSQYAYSFYAYDAESLCAALTHIQSLHRLHANATRLLAYPQEWIAAARGSSTAPLQDDIARLLRRAEREYRATLQPVPTSSLFGLEALSAEYGKVLMFNQTQYTRIVYVDTTASTILRPMDEMFHFSDAAVAMPRAYWKDDNSLSDLMILANPDTLTFERLVVRFFGDQSDVQQEVKLSFLATLNILFDQATFLPHRNYLLRASEFSKRQGEHMEYLGSYEEAWDAGEVIEDARFLVFDDALQHMPDCDGNIGQARTLDGVATCAEREIWKWLVRDKQDRRNSVCGPRFAQVQQKRSTGIDESLEEINALSHARTQRKIVVDQGRSARLLRQDVS